MIELPMAGWIDAPLIQQSHLWWEAAATAAHINLTDFDSSAPLEERLAWAKRLGLGIAGGLFRQSTDMQRSLADQIREEISVAANKGFYLPPEFMCADIVTGRKSDRDGVKRMKLILDHRLIDVLLVFKVSRMFRSPHKGFAFVQENVIEQGMRAISVTQGIDTVNKESWKVLMVIHGLADEMLLTAIADHVRTGLDGLFLQGFVVGALTVGYEGEIVEGAPLTKLLRPRRRPKVIPEVAELILTAFLSIRNGTPIRRAWKAWIAAGGPCDRRSKLGVMSYNAFRRLLSNPRYTGRWAFGRTRNRWSSRKDYAEKVLVPETEVKFVISEELRIVPDDLFFEVQQILSELKSGPRSPKRRKDPQLWDLVTDVFHCATCGVRFYQHGANGHGMTCKRLDLCPRKTVLNREKAVAAVCEALHTCLLRDGNLISETVTKAVEVDSQSDASLLDQVKGLERKIASQTRRIEDLRDLAGEGTDQDRAETKARISGAQFERSALESRLATVRKQLLRVTTPITPEQVRDQLAELASLLQDGASGRLGQDMIFRAATTFRLLVGKRITVHVEQRPARKRVNVRGVFVPHLLSVVGENLPAGIEGSAASSEPVSVWLRQPPKRDLLAEQAYQLLDVEGRTYSEACEIFRSQGHIMNDGILWQIRRRYFEMRGESVPPRPYNNGVPRKPRDAESA